MNIKQLIKENYEIAKSKGFYPDDSKIEDHLMGIVSELGEAYEAHRGGKFAFSTNPGIDINELLLDENKKSFYVWFDNFVKDSFEDEIADVFIRLFNLCGWLGIDTEDHDFKDIMKSNPSGYGKEISGHLKKITMEVSNIDNDDYFEDVQTIAYIFRYMINWCIEINMPIEKHIKAKMEYNKTRPMLHGKKY